MVCEFWRRVGIKRRKKEGKKSLSGGLVHHHSRWKRGRLTIKKGRSKSRTGKGQGGIRATCRRAEGEGGKKQDEDWKGAVLPGGTDTPRLPKITTRKGVKML